MRRYRRLRPRTFQQATYLTYPGRKVYPPPRKAFSPLFGVMGLIIFLIGMTVLVSLV